MQTIAPLAELGMYGPGIPLVRHFENSAVYRGWAALELGRIDAGVSTFIGVQSGLAMNSIAVGGSDEQQQEWLPRMARGEVVGAFGLTEPLSGSDSARGLRTTARREGDTWVLDGEKRWIGNATFADVVVIWAKDVADQQVKGFLVTTDTPGFTATKIEDKIALRTVQNADIVLDGVGCPSRADSSARTRSAPRRRCSGHPYGGRLAGRRIAIGAYEQRSPTPASACSSASRSPRTRWCRTCSCGP